MTVRILEGDCIELMRTLADNSIDSVVTDPPYGIGFMGKAWDHKDIVERAARRAGQKQPPHRDGSERSSPRRALAEAAGVYDLSPIGMRAFQEFSREWAAEALRVLKPGGYLLSFASPRTYHRMTCGIEDAGFEVRDQVLWIFGNGFPKSRNLTGEWEGWGSALKPAHEPICMARKPLIGTIAQNVLAHGTGALNIDGCRIDATDKTPAPVGQYGGSVIGPNGHSGVRNGSANTLGRWPANLIHDGSDEVLAAFPDASGQLRSVGPEHGHKMSKGVFGDYGPREHFEPRQDGGSAARYFYCAKASRADREAGCEGLPTKIGGMVSNTSGQHITRRDGGAPGARANHHPTVKPTELMRVLCRLVTPPGGTVLDPFAGSGSTGRGAVLEGFSFIGAELNTEYVTIARARIAAAEKDAIVAAESTRQTSLFAEVASA